MRMFPIVVAIGLTGCITRSASKLGPFVKDISARPDALVVDSCVLEFEARTNYTWWLFDMNATKSYDLEEGQCWRQAIPVGEEP